MAHGRTGVRAVVVVYDRRIRTGEAIDVGSYQGVVQLNDNKAEKKETEHRLIESIKRYFAEKMGEGIGDLKASFLLDVFSRESVRTTTSRGLP